MERGRGERGGKDRGREVRKGREGRERRDGERIERGEERGERRGMGKYTYQYLWD